MEKGILTSEKRLSPERHTQIRQWVLELNEATAVATEALVSGKAAGRMAHTRNLKGEISRSARLLTAWNEANGFYILENGDAAYPAQLLLTT